MHAEASFDPKPRSSIPPSPSGAADDAESSILDPRDLSTLFSEDYANNSLQASAFMRVEVSCHVLITICTVLPTDKYARSRMSCVSGVR